jgi:signal transduction histidine kinase
MQGAITVTIKYDIENKYLITSVSDTGIGISETDQKKLFTLFGKLSSTSQYNTSGIGLGLNICKKITETFNGSITV